MLHQLNLQAKLAWLGGFFDGEGCIGVDKVNGYYFIRIALTNTDLQAIKFCESVLVELGIHSATIQNNPRPKYNKPCYYLRISNTSDCLTFLTALSPYLMVKLERASLAMKMLSLKLQGRNIKEQTESLALKIKELNRRGSATT